MPRYRKLGYVALNVTDLRRARSFYAEMLGLEPSGTGPDGEAFFRCGSDHHTIMLHAASTYEPKLARIERLGHVVMRVPDLDPAVAFYRDVLGFRISDWIAGSACFLRCNPYHHGIGLFLGDRPQLHHVNFMVRGMDDLDDAIARFARSGVRIVFGPGRHRPSGSDYIYFHEPDGLTFEYSCGMEEFPDEAPRAPRNFESPQPSDGLWRFLRDPDLYKGVIETV